MRSRSDILHVARGMIGTPYHHQGRLPHVGLDCIGLLCVVADAIGMPYVDYKGYSRQPDGHTIINRLCPNFDTIDPADMLPGDVPVFFIRHRNLPQHAGILTPRGLVHTYADLGRVVEQGIEDFWAKRVHTVFRYKGVEPTYSGTKLPSPRVASYLMDVERASTRVKNNTKAPRCRSCGDD